MKIDLQFYRSMLRFNIIITYQINFDEKPNYLYSFQTKIKCVSSIVSRHTKRTPLWNAQYKHPYKRKSNAHNEKSEEMKKKSEKYTQKINK